MKVSELVSCENGDENSNHMTSLWAKILKSKYGDCTYLDKKCFI